MLSHKQWLVCLNRVLSIANNVVFSLGSVHGQVTVIALGYGTKQLVQDHLSEVVLGWFQVNLNY